MLKGLLSRWTYMGLLVAALGVSAGCVSNEIADNADLILEELDGSSAPTGSIEFEGETLVYQPDLPDLAGRVRSVSLVEDKKDLVVDYLVLQERIDCILNGVEKAVENGTTIQCQGKVLVWETGEGGLMGVSELLEEIGAREGAPAQRDYLTGYLAFWDGVQRIDRVVESLGQIQRSNSIPLFGALVKAIHRFPVLYEGDELVPTEDIPALLDQYRARDTDEARRDLVMEYLER